jgi:hypothetical protein
MANQAVQAAFMTTNQLSDSLLASLGKPVITSETL